MSKYDILKELSEHGKLDKEAITRLRQDGAKCSKEYNSSAVEIRADVESIDHYPTYCLALASTQKALAKLVKEIVAQHREGEDVHPGDIVTGIIYGAAFCYLNKVIADLHTELADDIDKILAGECSLEDLRPGDSDWNQPVDHDNDD